jgi:hypothetical protein
VKIDEIGLKRWKEDRIRRTFGWRLTQLTSKQSLLLYKGGKKAEVEEEK